MHYNRLNKIITAALLMSLMILPGCGLMSENSDEKEITPSETPVIVITSVDEEDEETAAEPSAEIQAEIQTETLAEPQAESSEEPVSEPSATSYENGEPVSLDASWEYASFSKINSGSAIFYKATENRKGLTVGVNAGHGTNGGGSVKTYCHPDMSPKVTGGTTAAGSIEATAVSGGMSFDNGEKEADVNLKLAGFIKDELLKRGYDVLMIRDNEDVQLDNVARTVICNNCADCHIAIHFDGDSTGSDKGCFFISVPDGIKGMAPVDRTWQMSEELGSQIVTALSNHGHKLHNGGSMDIDLTQTSFSTIPSVDVEYGNQCSDTSDANLMDMASATADGVEGFFQVAN